MGHHLEAPSDAPEPADEEEGDGTYLSHAHKQVDDKCPEIPTFRGHHPRLAHTQHRCAAQNCSCKQGTTLILKS